MSSLHLITAETQAPDPRHQAVAATVRAQFDTPPIDAVLARQNALSWLDGLVEQAGGTLQLEHLLQLAEIYGIATLQFWLANIGKTRAGL